MPALPVIRMPPDMALFVFLPPLLTTAAYALPLQAFRRNLLPIGLLATGLVLATTGIVTVIGHVYAGLGWAAGQLRLRVETVPLEIGISLATPYLAYHLAELFAGSAVLAVVALGLMLRSSAARVSSPVARLASRTVWSFLRFFNTGLVFMLLGLLIGEIAVSWPGWPVLRAGAIMAVAIIGARLGWMMIVPRLVAVFGAKHPTPSLGR